MKKTLTFIGLFIGLACVIAFKWFLSEAPQMAKKKSQTFQAKAKQAEAKIKLSSAYVALKADWVESGTYNEAMIDQVLSQSNDNYKILKPSNQLSQQICPDCYVSEDGFKIVAMGNIDTDNKFDIWTIDDKKQMIHVQNDAE